MAQTLGVSALKADMLKAEAFVAEQSAGLFVGVSNFEDPELSRIPFAVDDAVDMAYLLSVDLRLIAPARCALLLAGEPVKADSKACLQTLSDKGAAVLEAARSEIFRQLDRQCQGAGAEGLLALVCATHGVTDQGKDLLLAADTLRRRPVATSIEISDLADAVQRSPAPRRLVFLDACRERLGAGTRSVEASATMGQGFLDALGQTAGTVILSASPPGGYAYDFPEKKNGVFTDAVLSGLRGRAAADERGFITVQTLADHVEQQVAAWVRDNRPARATPLLQGIGRRIEGLAARFPLAVDPQLHERLARYRERRELAVERLKQNYGALISGRTIDSTLERLPSERPADDTESLLEEILALDGSARSQRAFLGYLRERDEAAASIPVLSPPMAAPPPPAQPPARALPAALPPIPPNVAQTPAGDAGAAFFMAPRPFAAIPGVLEEKPAASSFRWKWIPWENPPALAAYYLSLASFGFVFLITVLQGFATMLGFLAASLAVMFGIVGLFWRGRTQPKQGRTHSWVGIFLGIAGAFFWLIVWFLSSIPSP